jgi:hypothetical protein
MRLPDALRFALYLVCFFRGGYTKLHQLQYVTSSTSASSTINNASQALTLSKTGISTDSTNNV